MKINKRFIGKSALVIASLIITGLATSCADLWKEQHPGTYYTNNGETVADYLEGKLYSQTNDPKDYHGEFSSFVKILKKADLWGQMRTYGTYTCFAPDNDAIQQYIDLRREEAKTDSMKAIFQDLESVLQNKKVCDTIARTHLFNNAMYSSDLNGDGVLQHPNLLDRYVAYYSDSIRIPVYDVDGTTILKTKDGLDSTSLRLTYLINMQATIDLYHYDDTVQNGVVHRIDKVIMPSNKFIPGLMKENPQISIFYSALIETRLKDTLDKYFDDTYPEIEYSWTAQALRDNYGSIHYNETAYETGTNADRVAYPEKRERKYTVFVVPDSVLATYKDNYWTEEGGIRTVSALREYAKRVYNDPDHINDPDSLRTSPLNMLLSYHILPCWLSYDQFNTSQENLIKNRSELDELDVEDFFETLLPHSIMRISTPYANDKRVGIFINRKGTTKKKLEYPGIRIATSSEYHLPEGMSNLCVNGGYHYVDKFVLYDDETRNKALQTRMRIMACTLSPDFINSGARGRLNGDFDNTNINKMSYAFKCGYCDNFEWVEEQTKFYVRYRDASFGTFYGDEITVRGSYDIAFKLPPVPASGNYEVRVWNNSLASSGRGDRGVVQFYFHQYDPAKDANTFWRIWDWTPEGIPVDLRIGGYDSRIGMITPDGKTSDDDQGNRYEGWTDERIKEDQAINDKSMRNLGYMRGMDSYHNNGSSNLLSKDANCYRKIVCNEYMTSGNDYYIRMRQVYEKDGVFPFSFIEIVPKSVYENGEDSH